jgi:hypothetical protein
MVATPPIGHHFRTRGHLAGSILLGSDDFTRAEGDYTMLSNVTYNLMETAAVISKGLHRYPQFEEDALKCQACRQMWNEMKLADDNQLEKVVSHLKEHLDQKE